MNNIIEGNSSRNDDLIGRLHGIIRPFVLRRLKKDVETQMPGKYEHIVKCHLSRRQVRQNVYIRFTYVVRCTLLIAHFLLVCLDVSLRGVYG
jgi:SNF2 family DNA or RNA helicase